MKFRNSTKIKNINSQLQVLDQNENCIAPERCPCQENGIYYYGNQIFNKDSPCEIR